MPAPDLGYPNCRGPAYTPGMPTFRHSATGPGPAGDIWTITMHSSGSADIATVQAAWNTAVGSFITSDLGPMWSTETQCTQTQTDQLDPATGKNVLQASNAVTYKGTGAGQALPQRASVVTGLRTATPTRSGRGRMYWPAPSASELTTTGDLLSAAAATLATGLAAVLNTFSATSQPVIYHRLTRTSTPVTTVTVGVVLGTQRRRTNKVAPSYASATL